MQLYIYDHKCRGTVSMSSDWEDVLGSFDLQIDTTVKRAGIRDAFVVENYK